MPVIIPPGFAQVTLEFSALSPLGSTPVTTFGVSRAPSLDLLDAVYDWWHEDFRPRQDSTTQLLRMVARSDVGFVDAAVGEPGTRSGASAAPQAALLVRKRTGQAGRDKRGRMFWPHVLEQGSVGEDGTVNGTLLASLQIAANNLFAAMTAFEADPVLFHSASSDPTTITDFACQSQSATIRRRNRK